jgi:uncharacterized delta-60 repeat protein
MRQSSSPTSPWLPPRPGRTSTLRATAWLLPVAGMLAWQFVMAAPAHASGGDLDPAFGAGGKVITDIAGESAEASAVAVQPDGKIVAAGGADEGNGSALQDFALARYTANGALDPRFGKRGKVKLDFTGAGGGDRINALAVQADGNLVSLAVNSQHKL